MVRTRGGNANRNANRKQAERFLRDQKAFMESKTPELTVRQQTPEDKARLEELRAKKAQSYRALDQAQYRKYS